MHLKIKSINLINLMPLMQDSVSKVINFLGGDAAGVSKTDCTKIFLFYLLENIIESYKIYSGLIVFYSERLIPNKDSIISLNKVNKFLQKIKIPLFYADSFDKACAILKLDSPEYDELISNYKFYSEIHPFIVKSIKNLKFYKLEKTFLNNIQEQIKALIIKS